MPRASSARSPSAAAAKLAASSRLTLGLAAARTPSPTRKRSPAASSASAPTLAWSRRSRRIDEEHRRREPIDGVGKRRGLDAREIDDLADEDGTSEMRRQQREALARLAIDQPLALMTREGEHGHRQRRLLQRRLVGVDDALRLRPFVIDAAIQELVAAHLIVDRADLADLVAKRRPERRVDRHVVVEVFEILGLVAPHGAHIGVALKEIVGTDHPAHAHEKKRRRVRAQAATTRRRATRHRRCPRSAESSATSDIFSGAAATASAGPEA